MKTLYDFERASLEAKMYFFSDIYMQTLINDKFINKKKIAWDRELENYRKRGIEKRVEKNKFLPALFRPFVTKYHYFDRHFNGMFYQWANLYSDVQKNKIISVNKEGNSKDLFCLATNKIVDLHTTGDSQCLPLYYFNSQGESINNITNWGLQQFTGHYQNNTITKEDIFHYTYAVLHNPAYRKKYELNLKREFPRIPFYENFFQWRDWGKQLMNLHINYETVQPYNLTQHNYETKTETKKQKEIFAKVEEPEVLYARQPKLKVKLKPDKASGIIEIDELTFLRGVPKEAWEYKLGNRSALEWILDQYKEKKPSDPTIAEKFNTYRFADYKEQVIDLLKRVCTVSVETMKVVREMEEYANIL